MTTLDEARLALEVAEQDLAINVRLIEQARPRLMDVLNRAIEDAGAIRDVSDAEALAVRAAVLFSINLEQVSRLKRVIAQAAAELN